MVETIKGGNTQELPAPLYEYESRHGRVHQAMEESGVDAALITYHRDFYWLTGGKVDYWSAESPQWAIIWDGEPIGIVRHLESSTHQRCSYLKRWLEYYDEGPINPYDYAGCAANALKELGLQNKRIGINPRVMSLDEYNRLKELLPDAKLVDFRVERMRVVRSPWEIEQFRRAVKVNQDALATVIQEMEPGWSEWGVLRRIGQIHRGLLGLREYSWSSQSPTSCQVGSHMKDMHAIRSPYEMRHQHIRYGDGVWLEPGVLVHEYVGCMIRTAWFGPPPEPVQYAVKATCEALERLIDTIGPGKTAHEVDGSPRGFLRSKGLDFQHRSGYMSSEKWLDGGILSLTPDNPLVLQPNQVFHCPIHVHVPGFGYMGVSEQVLVTESGCEVLGDRDRTCPRQLFLK